MSLYQYNLTPYNRKIFEISDASENYRIYSTLTATVLLDVDLMMSYRMDSDLTGKTDLQYFYNERYEMAQELDADATSRVEFCWNPVILAADLTGVVNIPVPARYRMAGEMQVDARAKLEIIYAPNMFALLTAAVDSLLTEDEEMVFATLVLKPNDTLVIDSEVFMVTHNNENILDKYEGEWPFIDRKLDGIEVVGVSRGTAAVSILYRERYL